MEDIMALVVVLTFVGAVIGMAILFYKRHQRLKAEEERLAKERLDAIAKIREETSKRFKIDSSGNVGVGSAPAKKSTVPPRGKETTKTYTPSYTPSTTQSVQSYDSSTSDILSDIANIAIVVNTVRHWNDGESISTSSGSSSSSSSWGLDDDDSRKSISSSMSDSYSSSSSSDSWSSSDSGPSSDW